MLYRVQPARVSNRHDPRDLFPLAKIREVEKINEQKVHEVIGRQVVPPIGSRRHHERMRFVVALRWASRFNVA